jgi:hypothetical protein
VFPDFIDFFQLLFIFLFFLKKKKQKIQGKPDRSPEIRDFSMPAHGKSP